MSEGSVLKAYQLVTLPAQPAREHMRVIALICDLCARTIRHYRDDGSVVPESMLVQQFGDAFAVTVEMKAGETNLDGGAGETTSFDLCPICFKDKLKTWLERQGAEARIESWHN